MKPLPSSSAYARWLAIVRILTGAMWLAHGIPKFTKSDEFFGFMKTYVDQGLQTSTGPYHVFLANTVQPNLGLFGELVRLGEVCTGLALLLGLFSRAGGLVGILLTLNYLSARGSLLSSATLQSMDFTLMVLSAISLVLPTGRVWGVDAIWSRQKAKPTVVRAEFVQEPPLVPPAPPAPPPSPPSE